MYNSKRISLIEATRIVEERMHVLRGRENPIFSAIEDNELKLFLYLNGEWVDRDAHWYRLGLVKWPSTLFQVVINEGAGEVRAHEVKVLMSDIDRLWPAQVQSNHSMKTGRPRIWDWEEALHELHRLDVNDGTENKTQAALVRHLADWFAQLNGGGCPSDSEIKKRVKRWQEVSAEK